jgi:outer membrane lipoprotein SlyB
MQTRWFSMDTMNTYRSKILILPFLSHPNCVEFVSDSVVVSASVVGSVVWSVVGSVIGSVVGSVIGSVVGSVIGSVVGSVVDSVEAVGVDSVVF